MKTKNRTKAKKLVIFIATAVVIVSVFTAAIPTVRAQTAEITDIEQIDPGDEEVTATVEFGNDPDCGSVYLEVEDDQGDSLSIEAVKVENSGDTETVYLTRPVEDEVIDVVVYEKSSLENELYRQSETVLKAAYFEITSFTHDGPVVEGEEVTVDYNVTNTGGVGATQDIVFYVDGVEEDNKTDVSLEPGEYDNDTFNYTTVENDAPEIQVEVSTDDDTKSVIVTVQKEHTLTVEEPTGEGTLIVDGKALEDADYDPTYTRTFFNGTEVELEAVAEEDYYFVEWTGDTDSIEDPMDNQTTIEMLDDYTISAVFTIDTYELTINIEGEGSTEPEEGNHTYHDGENVTVKAIPAEGWEFVEWTGDYESEEEKITITMDENKTITAYFTKIITYQLEIGIEGEGQVQIDPEKEEYVENTEVNLTAIPEEGWYFEEWTGNYESTEEEITITMDSDKEITVVFSAYEAYFEVKIIAYDRNVKEGEYVTVRFKVTNTGEVEGTQDIVLHVEGVEEDRKEDVTLEPGEEYEGKFFWKAEDGSHLLRVSSDDDHDTVPITVEVDTLIPGFTALLLMIAGIIAVAIYQKKKR